MTETNVQPPAAKSGGLVRKLIWIAGGLVVLLVLAYFVVTSGGFVKSVILPKVAKAANAELAVADVELSPFSHLVLRDVKLTPKGAAPLLTAQLVRARYSLMSILRGTIAVEEVTVESPTITLVANADGTSNLDPLTQGQKSAPAAKPASASTPPQIDIKSVALKNATIRQTKNLRNGGSEIVELSNLNLTAANLKNGTDGKLEINAGIAVTQTTASLAAKLNGDFTFALTPGLMPGAVNGKAALTVERAGGSFADLASLGATLDAAATPTEIKQFALRFTRAGQPLGATTISGPFDAAKLEGKLNVVILGLDRNVLNIAGAASGIDFGTTLINSTNVIELTKAGAVITASGQLDAARVSLTRAKQTTPTLDLRCDYAVSVDNSSKAAVLQRLNLTGTQNARPLLQTELTSPMTISFGGTAAAAGDAALNLTLTGLNLADWRAFDADLDPAGLANLKVKLTSQQAGKQLIFDLDGGITGLAAKLGSNTIPSTDITIRARGTGAELKQFKLDEYRVELGQGGQPALSLTGSGTFDSATQATDLQIALRATVAKLLQLMPQPGANLTGGTIDLTGHVVSKGQTQGVTGKLTLAGLAGRYADFRFADFGSTVDLDLGMQGSQLDLRKISGGLREAGKAGGDFSVTGSFDTARKAGQFTLGLTNLNATGLNPFLESALGDKQLVSVAINSSATAKLEANGDAAVVADLKVSDLVVKDPKGSLPATPLEAKAKVDAGVAKNVAQIRQCDLTLTPTERAKNELKLSGSVDYSKTNAITGKLKLAADSLDVTRYYDIFGGGAKPAEAAKPASTPASEIEPAPVITPCRNFSFEASVGKFYLREVEATNFQFAANLDGGRVVLKPAQFVLNGAPVSATADLDLSVPGYKYEVNLGASPIPLAPLVNSFVPERKEQFHGVTLANAKIKGAGTTGPALRKNLSGDFSFATTNLDLAIPNLKSKLIKEVINVVVAIPELVKNPTATVGNLIGRLTGTGTKGGFADEVMARPIEAIRVQGRVADGKITLEQAEVHSSAFQASAPGEIALNDILTNSAIRFPVQISLNRALAEKAGLAGNTPTNQPMVALSHFLTMHGTVGEPKKEINYAVLGALALQASGGIVKQTGLAIGDKAGSLLNALGLGGPNQQSGSAQTTNTAPGAATNKSPANPQPPVNLLDLFKKPKKQ